MIVHQDGLKILNLELIFAAHQEMIQLGISVIQLIFLPVEGVIRKCVVELEDIKRVKCGASGVAHKDLVIH